MPIFIWGTSSPSGMRSFHSPQSMSFSTAMPLLSVVQYVPAHAVFFLPLIFICRPLIFAIIQQHSIIFRSSCGDEAIRHASSAYHPSHICLVGSSVNPNPLHDFSTTLCVSTNASFARVAPLMQPCPDPFNTSYLSVSPCAVSYRPVTSLCSIRTISVTPGCTPQNLSVSHWHDFTIDINSWL